MSTTSIIMLMASSSSSPTLLLSSKPSLYFSLCPSSSSLTLPSKPTKSFHLLCRFSTWSGLRHLGVSVAAPKALKLGMKKNKKRRCRGMVVHASLFGVGAPEALVIGVVALLVFGPKGLAEVARNLGKTLREFQPAIRELQQVSSEFKSTLEKEIGLDDIATQNRYNSNRMTTTSTPPPTAVPDDPQPVVDPNGASPETKAYTTEEYLKITEEPLKAVAAQQQSQSPPQVENEAEAQQIQSPSQGENVAEAEDQPQIPLKETADLPSLPSQKPKTET